MRPLIPVLVLVTACAGGEPPEHPPGAWSQHELAQLERLRLDTTPRPSPSNAYADDPAAAALGQAVFYDASFSPSGSVSCATCHDPEQHFADGRVLAQGVGTAERHTPSIVGCQWGSWYFWDGRADSLWSQALGPAEHPAEMGGDRLHVAHTLLQGYGESYEAVFGDLPDLSDPARFPPRGRPGAVDTELRTAWESMAAADQRQVDRVFANFGKALAAYERTLVPQEAPFDRYVDAVLAGDPSGAGHLDAAAVEGLALFLGEGNCVACHNGPMLTDRAFHNLGLPEEQGYDQGRQRGALQVKGSPFNCDGATSDAEDCPELRYLDPTFDDFVSAFKTPSLRYVAETAPYMHHGGFPTLQSVLAFYSTLPGEPLAGHRELTLKPLHLSGDQIAALVAFLEALTGDPLPESLRRPPAELPGEPR